MVRKDVQVKEFDEKLLEIRRVTKVTTWGRRLSFRATMLIWNWEWKIGLGTWKWSDVTIAIKKAVHDAYKHIVEVNITKDGSILYPITLKKKSSIIKLIPAASWTWLKAWSSVRLVLELAWFKNILSKIVGSNNKLNNAIATIDALLSLKLKNSHKDRMSKNKTAEEIISEKKKALKWDKKNANWKFRKAEWKKVSRNNKVEKKDTNTEKDTSIEKDSKKVEKLKNSKD